MDTKEQLALFCRALDALPVSFNVKDSQGRYAFMNAQQLQHAGKTAAELFGQPVGIVGGDHWRKVVLERDQRILESGQPMGPFRDDFSALFGFDGVWLTYKAPISLTNDGPPDHVATLSFEITSFVENENELRRAAFTDVLTGLYNRRWLDEELCKLAAAEMKRELLPSWIFIIDADHFKQINDTLGHEAGDRVLREIAVRLRRNIRMKDIAVRLGGEEFLVLVRDVEREEAVPIAERIRESFDGVPILQVASRPTITVSIGCTQLQTDAELDSTLKRADDALYRAKRSGRNRVAFEEEVICALKEAM